MTDISPTQHPEEENELLRSRRKKMQRLEELGIDPWGHRFDDRSLIADIRSRSNEIGYCLESGQVLGLPDLSTPELKDQFREWIADQGKGKMQGPTVRAAGRIMLSRDTGKLRFIDIQDWTGKIQLFVGRKQVGEENWEAIECLDLGDIIGVDGELRVTKTGELSIFASKVHFLTKTLQPPPAKHMGMTDPELRQRQRYIDLAYNEGVTERFLKRSKIVQSIRQTLTGHGFVEIEGPTLQSVAGGAAARPFTTHHNTLELELYMRISLELYLKRLLVGGMERVFEVGRVYRNEGISLKHNPEFTMLEVYQAFGDYHSMMDLTEQIILNAIKSTGADFVLPWGEGSIDFTPPFERRSYDELFAENTGIDPSDPDQILQLGKELHLETKDKHSDVIKNEIFEEKVEDALIGPIFVTDYPASICPLTKRKLDNPAIAERFELFINGMELANAYTELNDPDLQEKLFQTQLQGLAEEDSMAKMDHDFVRALKNGMPPAGGMGLGIDRLVMLLTNSQSIRDIILFPLLRQETET
ncbi:MAG: lysine--tRNA ligase [Pirellulaceae bacterium]|jgi:lysyl-tRNA synthetase, class II|nr:lysine--tRNA ligase [Pirellulaceae bacterium]